MINKVSVDASAREYWKKLYGDFGEAMVRDIPRRIKAALADMKKVASVDESASVLPLAHAKDDDLVYIEGIYRDASTKMLFKASINSDGDVVEVKTVDLK
jgi:hypothetical protein